MSNAILDSLSQNYLGLFTSEGNVRVDVTREFLGLSQKELAKAFGLSVEQIRVDRMGGKTLERIKELAYALESVAEVFEGDKEKTSFWLNTPNHNFGGSSPKRLILNGRYQKVLKFIMSARAS